MFLRTSLVSIYSWPLMSFDIYFASEIRAKYIYSGKDMILPEKGTSLGGLTEASNRLGLGGVSVPEVSDGGGERMKP